MLAHKRSPQELWPAGVPWRSCHLTHFCTPSLLPAGAVGAGAEPAVPGVRGVSEGLREPSAVISTDYSEGLTGTGKVLLPRARTRELEPPSQNH